MVAHDAASGKAGAVRVTGRESFAGEPDGILDEPDEKPAGKPGKSAARARSGNRSGHTGAKPDPADNGSAPPGRKITLDGMLSSGAVLVPHRVVSSDEFGAAESAGFTPQTADDPEPPGAGDFGVDDLLGVDEPGDPASSDPTCTGHGKRVLGAILNGDRRDLLETALGKLTEDCFTDREQRGIFTMMRRYANVTGGDVLDCDAMADQLRSRNVSHGQIAIYRETYGLLASKKYPDGKFRWAVEQLQEEAGKRRVGEALADAMQINTRDDFKDKRGRTLTGFAAAAEYGAKALAAAATGETERFQVDLIKQRAREQQIAKSELAAEAIHVDPAEVMDLKALLESEDEGEDFRIADLMPEDADILIPAPAKAGKTTLVGNIARCWADGEPLFGRFPVHAASGPLVIIDPEMPVRLAKRWLREQRIEDTGRVRYVNIKGKCSTFNILSPEVRAEWVAKLQGAGAVLLDGLAPVLGAIGLTESNEDVRAFLAAWNLMLEEAGRPRVVHLPPHRVGGRAGARRVIPARLVHRPVDARVRQPGDPRRDVRPTVLQGVRARGGGGRGQARLRPSDAPAHHRGAGHQPGR